MKDSRRCTATAKRTGERCQNAAIKGANVCRVHGGSASQVKKKAQERLDEMADSTTADIQRDIEDLQEEYDAAETAEEKLDIIAELRKHWKLILDRTGHGPTEKRELGGDGGGPLQINFSEEVVETGWGDEQ